MMRTLRGRPLKILMYHAVVRSPLAVADWCFLNEIDFRRQMELLSRHHEVVPLSQAPEWSDAAPDRPAVALTFDDGFQNNHDVVFPILKQLGLPFTIFLPTAFIGSDRRLWFCEVNRAITRTRQDRLEWRGRTFDLATTASRVVASAQIQASLKELPHGELLRELDGLIDRLGVDASDPDPESPYRTLTAAGIRTLASSGLVEFGAHTQSHAILSLVCDGDRESEINGSIERIEQATREPCRLFAYPNGRQQDYDQTSIDILQRRGIRVAVTTIHGDNLPGQSLLELKRIGIGSNMRLERFEFLVSNALP